MRKAIAIFAATLFVFTALAMLPAPAHAATPQPPTELIVLDVQFNSEAQVDKYIGTGYQLSTDVIKNLSYSYSLTENAADLAVTYPGSGWYLLGGFTPALNTTIQLDVKIPSPGFNGATWRLKTSFFDILVIEYVTKYELAISYFNASGGTNTWYTYTPTFTTLPWLHIKLSWYGNRTFYFEFSNETTVFWKGWNCTHQDYTYSDQKEMFPPWVFMKFNPGASATTGQTYHAYIRNLKQTVRLQSSKNLFGYVPMRKYAAMGFDGPYNVTYENAYPLLLKYGIKATWFWSPTIENTTIDANLSGWNFTVMKDIMSHGQEFGIHTDTQAVYNTTEIADLNSQFNDLISMAEKTGWKNSSFVWTSSGNDYAWPYNDYVWNKWNAIGRKVWGHYEVNQGYISNHDVGLNVQTAAEHGWSWIGYTHRVGGVESVDITVHQFESFLKNNTAHNIHVVGYFEYWSRYAAPEYVYGTVNKINDWYYKVQVNYNKFKVPTGFKVAVRAPGFSALSTQIYDETTHTYVKDFKVYDWGIVFEAHDGHTYILKDAVQHSVNISIDLGTGMVLAVIPLMFVALFVRFFGEAMQELSNKMKSMRK